MVTRQEYEKLCQEVWEHNRLYYIENAPVISDYEFDQLLKRIEKIETEHPEWILPSSPTQRVGEAATGFKTYAHEVPMLSLANTYNKEEVDEFCRRTEKILERDPVTYACELKMDGIACTVFYEKGLFVRGVTRGDGWKGDDITHNLRAIQTLPLQLYGKHIPELLEIRGEVYMSHSSFERLNEEKRKKEEEPFANPRNAAGGTLKLLDPAQVAKRNLSIVFYGIAQGLAPDYQTELPAYLHKLGLPSLALTRKAHSSKEIMEYAEEVQRQRSHFPFDIDGIVVKVDNIRDHDRMGTTNKHPRSAIAYKFSAQQAETRVQEITVQVGRTGVLTPVAELDPVLLAGSTIRRASLHNQDEVRRLDVRVGDKVIIEKGGDVIPKVVQVVDEEGRDKRPHWEMPTHCPACGALVEKVPGEVAVRCHNKANCPGQVSRRIAYFVSKGAMDIDHVGGRVVEQLIEAGLIGYPSDLYLLTKEQLLNLEGFQEKSAQNVLESIERSKKVPLDRFIIALGIKHVGTATAEAIAAHGETLEGVLALTEQELIAIEGIGEKVAHAIVDHFSHPEQQKELQRLLERGVTPEPFKRIHVKGHFFFGKTVVITGTLVAYTRGKLSDLIKERGGKVTNTVTKKTDYLICGDDPGSKLDKAKELGVEVINEERLLTLL